MSISKLSAAQGAGSTDPSAGRFAQTSGDSFAGSGIGRSGGSGVVIVRVRTN